MDQIDAKILELLQTDASQPVKAIASGVGVDEADCAKRIAALEASGVIKGHVALLDPRKIGTKMTAFVAITTPEHSKDWLDKFHAALMDFPEVVEFYRMSGQVDYLLKVVVADIEQYDQFYKKLISAAKLKEVSSTFAMEEIKYTTKLPINAAS